MTAMPVGQASSIIAGDDVDAAALDSVQAAVGAINAPELAHRCRVETLAGGASNRNFLITRADTGERFVLRVTPGARIAARFGLDRWRGLEAHRAAHTAGVAPRLCGITLPDGHSLVEYVDRPVVDARLLRQPDVLEACTRTLRAVHHSGTVSGRFSAMRDIRRYRTIAQREGLALPDDIDWQFDVAERIESVFAAVAVPDRLCHNDVQLANFLHDADGTCMLDWEYAGQGNPYFDLAMIAANGDLQPAELDRMLVAYFGRARDCDRDRVTAQQFQSSLREAMWSVIAKPILQDTGWDYDEWSHVFFDKARALARSDDFERLLDRAGPNVDDPAVLGVGA